MDDLPLLVEYFLGRMNRELGKRVHTVSPEAMWLLTEHHWRGNVRELESTVKYAMVHATGDILTPDCLPDPLRLAVPPAGPEQTCATPPVLDVADYTRRLLDAKQPDIYHNVVAAVDRVVLSEVLRHTKGNQVEAAKLLGVSRNTLRAKLRALGMVLEKQLAPESERVGQ
jgi:two-component system nitrogen regulation response regulator GlnG